VALSAGYVSDMTRLNEEHFEGTSVGQLKQCDPIDPRRLHRDGSNLAVAKPVRQIMQVSRKGSERPYGVLRALSGGTATEISSAPMSIPAASRCSTGSIRAVVFLSGFSDDLMHPPLHWRLQPEVTKNANS